MQSARRWGMVATAATTAVALSCTGAIAWLGQRVDGTSASVADLGPISGTAGVTAAGLYPGRTTPASVDVVNDGSGSMAVVGIGAGSSPAGGGCPAGAVTSAARLDGAGLVGPDGQRHAISPHGTGSYAIDVTMAADAPPECSGRTFVLSVALFATSPG